MVEQDIYYFYSELKDYQPKIWRRFEITGEKTIAELAYTIMIMYEMHASHLFSITQDIRKDVLKELGQEYSIEQLTPYLEKQSNKEILKRIRYELPGYEDFKIDTEKLLRADKLKVKQITRKKGMELSCFYDFGDSWEVSIYLENCEKKERIDSDTPYVTEGEGYGIIEDVGGVYGLEKLAASLKVRAGDEYEDYIRWLDSSTLDLEMFDQEDMNFRLRELLKVYKEIYEKYKEPSKQEVDLLLRTYKNKGSRGY
ncbi:plasmid pRiA4b ORF-3 family protein [Enterococcus wangshanyuanii]|uniref:Plasmid pRiA4b ORF-3 family protein n=1 Tax=Enterococcus wangshanyuanii TaxID=2005703 RepID=A0ABQ1PVJ9_9ENTE|nr:plasmid pRiA4b ORF-3 family protein [Enterococcus wangshanyuanii]GGD04511.1 plasmid pRiA4b ORF-3 family protein [Enterococcus wangshanyuanii]